jgi:hypothetical protein
MSINKHININSKRSSLLQRALKYIKDTLAFRNQWLHLQKCGKTPNYHDLKSGERDRKHCDKGLSDESNIKPSEAEESLESEPALNLGALSESLPITVEKHNVEEPTSTELYHAFEGAGHDAENGLVYPCPVPLVQIEKSLPILETVDANNQLFHESVLPAGSMPNVIKGTTVKLLDSCSGEVQEVAAATYGSAEELVHQKELKEIASSPKKTNKNRSAQVHGLDRRDQMQLPFE